MTPMKASCASVRRSSAWPCAVVLVAGCALLSGCESEPLRDSPRPAPVAAGAAPVHRAPPAPATADPDKDGPPNAADVPGNLLAIPDAVPQKEARSDTGNPESYVALGKRYYVLQDSRGFKERGLASWYGKKFHGKRTSSGAAYDMFKMTAAHRTLPIPCYARITNLDNGQSVVVKVNDRGPFHSERIVDVSYAAAAKLGMIGHGPVPVELQVVEADGSPLPQPTIAPPAPTQLASAAPKPQAGALVSTSLAAGATRFLQTGVFSDPVNASTMREQLLGLGFNQVQMRSERRGETYVYRVLVGPLLDVASVDGARRRLAELQLPAIPLAN